MDNIKSVQSSSRGSNAFRFVAGSKKSTRDVGDSGGGSRAACDFLRVVKSLPTLCRAVMDNVMCSRFVAGSKKSTRIV